MVKKPIYYIVYIVAFLFLLSSVLTACGIRKSELRVGHGGGYPSAALYAADFPTDLYKFKTSADIVYALIASMLDVGFVEAEKLAALAELDGFEQLTVIGKVTYPYGATLVLRKGLTNVRLQELGKLTIAVSEPGCTLLEAFIEDATRWGADISGLTFAYMPFDAMLPALAAEVVDAAITRGSYALIALQEGHNILYQNWEVEPGDECCPAIIDQAMLVLLARRDKLSVTKPFIDALISAQALPSDQLRQAVAKHTVISFDLLQGHPVPEFSPADDELVKIFVQSAKDHGPDRHHAHDDENDDHHGHRQAKKDDHNDE